MRIMIHPLVVAVAACCCGASALAQAPASMAKAGGSSWRIHAVDPDGTARWRDAAASAGFLGGYVLPPVPVGGGVGFGAVKDGRPVEALDAQPGPGGAPTEEQLASGHEGALRDPQSASIEQLLYSFKRYTGGVKMVFARTDLPKSVHFDKMYQLAASGRRGAAALLLQEAQRFPPEYLGSTGLKKFGVFAALVSSKGDGYRPYDPYYGGYKYYGKSDLTEAVVASFYSDSQLPLTFHHEVFHHIDASTGEGADGDERFGSDDPRFADAVSGKDLYPALEISPEDLQALRRASSGRVLRGAVSDYSSKTPGEDQAETARYFMRYMADSLVQAAVQPALPGSQRILHVITLYAQAVPGGAGASWFVDKALGRRHAPAQSSQAQDIPPGTAPLTDHDEPILRIDGSAKGGPKADENPYISKVDQALKSYSEETRANVRRAQTAAVKLKVKTWGGSGVNVSPDGLIFTAGHVVTGLGGDAKVIFPDGRDFDGKVVAYSKKFDLAIVDIENEGPLPFARISEGAPKEDSTVVAIGQPSQYQNGAATGYKPFHVSVGRIRGYRKLPGQQLDDQLENLGGVKHDAWTYWGHSGCPLFDLEGRVVALHNSWDSDTGLRHGVPHEVLLHFLESGGYQLTEEGVKAPKLLSAAPPEAQPPAPEELAGEEFVGKTRFSPALRSLLKASRGAALD